MKTTIKIPDMMCEHCKKSITEGLLSLCGVDSVEIDLSAKNATVEHTNEVTELLACIDELGFDASI